jgi:hypothetical protein
MNIEHDRHSPKMNLSLIHLHDFINYFFFFLPLLLLFLVL